MKSLVSAVIITVFCVSAGFSDLTSQQKILIDKAIPGKLGIQASRKYKVLIWNTPFMDKCPHKGYSVPQAAYMFQKMGQKTGLYDAVISDDISMYLPENLKKFDVIIWNNSNGNWLLPTNSDMENKFNKPEYGNNPKSVQSYLQKSLVDWIKAGGGIVAYHHAIGANNDWPEFYNIIGASYWGHPWNQEVTVTVEEPGHPLTAAFKNNEFKITEEIFQYNEPYSRKNVRVLLSLNTLKTDMTVPWIHRRDDDFALAWIHRYGKGRIFYSAFGHRTEIWCNPVILQFYLDGIQYVTGDLKADDKPSAKVGAEK